jgi:hypothetical protein
MANEKSTLDALFKDVYADKLDTLLPDFSKLLKSIPFREAKKTGRDYVQPVKLTNEQGFTYGSGLQTLSDAIDADNEEAKIRGHSLTLKTAFSYDAASNMASSKGSFISATKYRFMAMMESMSARLEAQILYGNSGFGETASTANVSATETDLVIKDSEWAPGIWSGLEGAEIDLHEGGLVNVTGALTIDSIDHDSKTIRVSGLAADITAVDVAGADQVVHFRGAASNEMTGIRSIVGNSGVLYGISGADYSLWRGNSHAVGANLNLKEILIGNAKAAAKGLMEDSCVYVSSLTFSSLANDQASLRRYSGEVKKATDGFTSIEFHAPSGSIEVIPHPMVKEGEAMSFPKGKIERIGATDVTFQTPGGEGGEMFKHLPNQTGYEVRSYSEQSIFLPCPAKCVLYTGIANS